MVKEDPCDDILELFDGSLRSVVEGSGILLRVHGFFCCCGGVIH